MVYKFASRLFAKASQLFMPGQSRDTTSDNLKSGQLKKRKRSSSNGYEDLTPIMMSDFVGKLMFLGRKNSLSCLLCLIILFLPITFIFLGIAIGNYLSPKYILFPSKEVIADSTVLNYTWYNSHNLTINFVGGLGNQMFQYAALYGISKANGFKPVINGRGNLISDGFKDLKCIVENNMIWNAVFQNEKIYLLYLEKKSNAFDNKLFSLNFMKNIRISGFFQSWRYFDHVRTDIKRQLSSFNSNVTREVEKFLSSTIQSFAISNDEHMSVTDVKLVGIHVRRGDFLHNRNVDKGYVVADNYFYQRAMQFYLGKFKHVIFVVTSDDPKWAATNIRSRGQGYLVVHSKFSDFYSPFYDLKLLASCNHTIISGGSFGWWAAWLAGGITVYSKDFVRPGSDLSFAFRPADFYLPQWISM